jgi:transcriptional regulator with XRE-family HTH domain
MRGADDHLSIGERIAFYRRRRGLTQPVLAGLVGRSVDWVGKVERGERQLRRLDVLTVVARALRVEISDLVGQPVLVEDVELNDDIPAVRDALMAPRRLSRILYANTRDGESPDPVAAARFTEGVCSEYQGGRLGGVIAGLPGLIRTAQRLEDAAGPAEKGRAAWAVSARVHHLAATTLAKVGEVDLAWIAAERAMHAADEADDPLVLASAARSGTHALLMTGRYADALDLGTTATEWLRGRLSAKDPAALSLIGMLNLRTAVAAARQHDRQTANELLGRAAYAASVLGRDANYWQTGFGPTNVELHRLSAALDLGDVPYVVAHGPKVRADHLPAERGVTHLIDLARAHSLVADDGAALDALMTAEQTAPSLVRHSPIVRETVKDLHRRAPASGGARSSVLFGLAERCRAVQ